MQIQCVHFGVGTELLNAAGTEIRVLRFSQLYCLGSDSASLSIRALSIVLPGIQVYIS